ncbi:acyltransferase [Clostridium beijerinckii]|uniref:acyltransferase n=1 Tax=Clostridium beijerinckii TaxID=1520 RepID=UPI00098CA17F|nr:N-acetyltransferase [Clostridium beijerinckii]NRT75730.1 acetyltransferase-like isoleucine patch superfamily enzyme [Clostridium beijerinckii]OOM41828.1 dTDP-3-amino-3,6-dideoxy-alpha-D-galactopyranose 3-N-acetyltransferase [Clostridium beijerinckii]
MYNCIISNTSTIMDNVIIGNNVLIEDNCYIDSGVIIRDNVHIKQGSFIGARSILGEYLADFYCDKLNKVHPLVIGENAIVRSDAIIYGDTIIGNNFQTGHRVTIREKSILGNNVRVGTSSDIQEECIIGNYVSIHSNVFVGEKSVIKDFVWIFPHVILTNDPTPPSQDLIGVTLEKYASIAAGSIILPGINIGAESLVGAGSVVTKNVEKETVVIGNPAKKICLTQDIRSKLTGQQIYPWKYTFSRGMPWDKIGYEQWLKSENLK